MFRQSRILISRTALALAGCISILAAQELPQVDGTTGAPLGGIGTGGVKFCGNNGNVYFTDEAPVKCGNNTASYVAISTTYFALYSNRAGQVTTRAKLTADVANGRYNDDAIYPIQKATFNNINGVNVQLVGSCPWEVLDSNKMNYPCALFQFALTNTQSTSVDVAVGFMLTSDNTPTLVTGKGFRDETANSHQKAVYAKNDDAIATITIGNNANFLTTGQCSNALNGHTNMVAVKVTLAANQTKNLKFAFAWYNATNISFYHYTNLFAGAGAVADSCLSNFDRFMTNAQSFVTRMRGSNIPDWVVNSTLNALCLLTNNSRYFQDGRMLYAEGSFGTQGTMDQSWHARYAVSQLCPFYAWKELEFWARTQKIDATGLGQIHHDLISDCGGPFASFDQTTWADYQDINPWPDLNCGFIFSVYEAFMATADHAKLDYFWPYVLKAGQRILNQVKQFGNTTTYPYTFETSSHSSYDWNGGGATYLYNSSLTIPAYKAMSKLAAIQNDAATKAKFDGVHDTAVASFKKRFIDNIFPTADYCEAIGAGPWISDCLKLGHDFSSADIDKLLNQLNSFYNPLVNGCGVNRGPDFGGNYFIWEPYMLTHYADLALIAGKKDIWDTLRHDHFQRCYQDRDRVFNMFIPAYLKPTPQVPVSTDPSGHDMYITYLDFIREYHSIIGYQRNRNSGELWLEPNLPAVMANTLKDAMYIAPEGNGTINYTLNPNTFEQFMTLKPDSGVTVNQIYVKDVYQSTLFPVWVNGARIADSNITRIGMGYGKELKINWSGTVSPAIGLRIEITSTPTTAVAQPVAATIRSAPVIRSGRQIDISYSLDHAGRVSISIFNVNGQKIADVADRTENAGMHHMTWTPAPGMRAAFSPCIVAITAGDGKTVRKVMMPGK
jgi:uncharacterized protein (DUF608 family)